jgi:hypothetical protein
MHCGVSRVDRSEKCGSVAGRHETRLHKLFHLIFKRPDIAGVFGGDHVKQGSCAINASRRESSAIAR